MKKKRKKIRRFVRRTGRFGSERSGEGILQECIHLLRSALHFVFRIVSGRNLKKNMNQMYEEIVYSSEREE